MIGNPGPWILISLAVMGVLWWKGYLKLPKSTHEKAAEAGPLIELKWPRNQDLNGYSVDTLAAALSAAARRDAQSEYEAKAAAETARIVRERFMVPFHEPVSTGSTPPSP